jgi:hypothetical protein
MFSIFVIIFYSNLYILFNYNCLIFLFCKFYNEFKETTVRKFFIVFFLYEVWRYFSLHYCSYIYIVYVLN